MVPAKFASRVDALAVQLPVGDPRRGEFRSRIAALGRECGCAMGGAFLVGATALTVVRFAVSDRLSLSSLLLATGYVFAASMLGKLVGLGLARIRLHSLRRTLVARLSSLEVRNVDLH